MFMVLPTPNMYDFDGDGDLDLICGEFIDKLTWFENIGTREVPRFAEGRYLENKDGIIKFHIERYCLSLWTLIKMEILI